MKKNLKQYGIALLAGILLGWLFFHTPRKTEEKHEHSEQGSEATVWTCSMHPQIRMDKAGKCPICGMDLIQLNQSNVAVDSDAIHLSKESAQLANVQTTVVTKQKPEQEVRLYGKVQADERLQQSQVAHISGRIEKLLINFTGESVRKGQTLALIYSPELITAQQELIETAKTKQAQPEIYEASKEKLRQWKLTEEQIEHLEADGNPLKYIEIKSTSTGIVSAKRVNIGDYINQGTVLYDIADLTHVWVLFDAYESDLPFLAKGNTISFTLQALPGSTFSNRIQFIDPVIDPVTRVSKVRVEINNQAGKLKPEMFATGIVHASLNEYRNNFIIPRSAVLWTGKRSVVYVKQTQNEEFIFKLREVELGPSLGNNYVIMSGLNEGEEIVSQGTFSVDAAAQLEGKPSMMNVSNQKEISRNTIEIDRNTGEIGGNNKNEGNTVEINRNKDGHGNTIETNRKTTENKKPGTDNSVKAEFGVSGNCDMCKERIEEAAKSVKGVTTAAWNIDTKKMYVEFNRSETSSENIQKAIAKAGHDTEKVKADEKTYNELPECCWYR